MVGKLFVGLMSGTSLDGVDVALVEFNAFNNPHRPPHVIQTHFLPYSPALRTQILALQHPTDNELEMTALAGNQLARLYADAVNALLTKQGLSSSNVSAIGCHGQTIRHQPGFKDGTGFTLQIGNAALLSELTGITVVSDFRSRDIAAGGQGAPLVPAFHQAVFSHPQKNRILVNIGGIANLTYLPKTDDVLGAVVGFDSGPGNMLIDYWTKLHLNQDYDTNGQWAATGLVLDHLLADMLAEPYFALPPPKSTGRDLFHAGWLKQHLLYPHLRPQDVARTLVELTAETIFQAIRKTSATIDEVYLCGGGAHNALLVTRLKDKLANTPLTTTEALGIGVDWVEAIAFAWLAKQTLEGKTSSLPEVTGAKGARILGAIYPH
ncbi:MAG TPA: anhydro-N-acetylmuramic acid kinase [Methylotenera sp.]|nr:anhydro-N-acetylmuramic acid kinase [Methylotenera sp.]